MKNMKIEDKNGNIIKDLNDWSKLQSTRHWKKGRSAYSTAQFILEAGGASIIQSRVSDILGETIEIELITPEFEVRFDEYGQGRVHDLALFGKTRSDKKIFIGVEAKVDESFGAAVSETYLAAKAKQIVGKSTKAPERIEKLLSRHFNKPDPSMFNVRYQLLYATVGTLAAKADIHVLFVIVFKTDLYNENIGAENYQDYIRFMNISEASTVQLSTKETLGHKLNINGQELLCLYEHFTF